MCMVKPVAACYMLLNQSLKEKQNEHWCKFVLSHWAGVSRRQVAKFTNITVFGLTMEKAFKQVQTCLVLVR